MVTTRAAALVASGVLVLLYATPLRGLWAHAGLPWWSPFVPWALVIAAIAAGRRR